MSLVLRRRGTSNVPVRARGWPLRTRVRRGQTAAGVPAADTGADGLHELVARHAQTMLAEVR